jgi:hypothetical protein
MEETVLALGEVVWGESSSGRLLVPESSAEDPLWAWLTRTRLPSSPWELSGADPVGVPDRDPDAVVSFSLDKSLSLSEPTGVLLKLELEAAGSELRVGPLACCTLEPCPPQGFLGLWAVTNTTAVVRDRARASEPSSSSSSEAAAPRVRHTRRQALGMLQQQSSAETSSIGDPVAEGGGVEEAWRLPPPSKRCLGLPSLNHGLAERILRAFHSTGLARADVLPKFQPSQFEQFPVVRVAAATTEALVLPASSWTDLQAASFASVEDWEAERVRGACEEALRGGTTGRPELLGQLQSLTTLVTPAAVRRGPPQGLLQAVRSHLAYITSSSLG